MITPQGGSVGGSGTAEVITKQAVANGLDVMQEDRSVALLYTTTPITITKILTYNRDSDSSRDVALNVGIEGDADAIVAAEMVEVSGHMVTELTITGSPDVAAGHMVTASIHSTGEEMNGMLTVAIEYHETE